MFSKIGSFSAAIRIDFDGPALHAVRVLTGDLPARDKKAGHHPLKRAWAILDAPLALDRLQPPLPASASVQT